LLGEKLPFFALSALDAVITIQMQQKAAAFMLDVSFADRTGNALVSVFRYLGKFAWPADLTIVYAHPGAWPAVLVAGALAGFAGLTVFAWRQRHARPWLPTGWIWFLAALLPMLGLLQVGMQAMADRYTYLALLGIELALLFSLRALPSRAVAVGGALVLTACTAATWHQQEFWRDSLTLYRRAVAVEERNDFAQGVLAYTCYENRLADEAERHARRALELSPANTWGLLTLALIHEDRGENEAALACYTRLIAGDPGSVRAYAQRGGLYGRLGRLAEAAADFGRATQLDPRDASVWWAHAESLAAQEKFAEAVPSYAHVLELQPDNAEAHVALGYALLTTGRRAEGTAHWREAVRLRPDFIGVRERLQRLEP
jgi:tetratricopeptide (TPR) repeat protein